MTPDAILDKRLEMIFTCCHPALDSKSRVALTLRTLGGLTTEEIARAFLDKTATMAQRLVRAKEKIKKTGIPYKIPDSDILPERINSVLSVLYLIFNEGYSASSGDDLLRHDLSDEAIRLARIIHHLMPEETELAGLLALMLNHDARRYARTDSDGQMVALEHQNRRRWDQSKIKEGAKLVEATLSKQRLGPYQLQAAISAVHNQSPSWEETDWVQIEALYCVLHSLQPSPIVRINQAVAMSYSRSIDDALRLLDQVAAEEKSLETYQPYFAARADLLQRKGNHQDADTAFVKAIELTDNAREKAFLTNKMAGGATRH